jgi:hypothetical protein
MTLASYQVWVAGQEPAEPTTVMATSRGRAKAEYHRDIGDCWPDLPFTRLRCRKVFGRDSRLAERVAALGVSRGLAGATLGGLVECLEARDEAGQPARGRIVGTNASANFDVLFESGKHTGLRLNCHPDYLRLAEEPERLAA